MKLYLNEEKDNKSKIAAAIAVAVYIAMWVVLILVCRFDMTQPQEGEGIMISLGDVEQAAPGAHSVTDQQQVEASEVSNNENVTPQQTMTQDIEDAPAVKEKTKKPEEKKVVVEKPREVNQRAIFKGRTTGDKSGSSGDSQGVGTQGDPSGDPLGSPSGTGRSADGNSFSLSGRTLVGSLPRPQYNAKDEGRVVIEVTVGSNGEVLTAKYSSKGSTTQSSSLVVAAESAAKRAKFSVKEESPIQKGTITYIFRMN